MGKLTVNMPNRPQGEEVEIQGDGWRAICENGSSVEVPELDEDMVVPAVVEEDQPEEEDNTDNDIEITNMADLEGGNT